MTTVAALPKLFALALATVCLYSEAKEGTILGDKTMRIICREDYIYTDEVIIGACKHLNH